MNASDAAGAAREFVGVVEVLQWGRSTYTIIRLPEELADDAREAGTQRVAGTLDGVDVNVAIVRAPVVDGPFMWAGQSLLRRVGTEAGAPVACVLAPADPDEVDTPPDVADALERAGIAEAWERMSPASRRRRLYPVNAAKRDETRARRISALIAELVASGGPGDRGSRSGG